VYYQGSEQTPAQIQNSIGNDVPGFEAGGTVVDSPSTGNVTSTTSQTNNSGSVVQEYVSVSQNSDISISAKAETTNGNSNVDFSVTVQGSEDWDGAQMFIESTLNEIDYDTSGVGSQDKANLNIYISDSNKIDPDFVDAMIERDVKITVTTPNASVWKMQGTSQKAETKSGRYDMRYTLSAGTQELCTELGSQTAFVLQFQESAEVNSEVLIRLGTAWANQQATLFQRGEKGITKVQTVIVDREGYAHFFLASVDKEVLYAIGMHLMTEVTTDIVPEEMLSEYGAAVRYEEIQYEITGRKSSWGVNLGQVMSVLAVVMISAVVVIGFTMYLLNKRRLKNGYIPQWDDEEE